MISAELSYSELLGRAKDAFGVKDKKVLRIVLLLGGSNYINLVCLIHTERALVCGYIIGSVHTMHSRHCES